MKSSNCKKHENIKTNKETSDFSDTEDSESLLGDKKFKSYLKPSKKINLTHTTKSIEVANVKHLPTLFFFIYIILLSFFTFQFAPKIYNMGLNKSLYKDKMTQKYIPELIGEQSLTVKGITFFSQLILVLIISFLTSLIKQRISVPEMIRERWRNTMVFISSTISVACMVLILYYNKETLILSQKVLGMADNIFFLIYILSSFTYCYLTYSLLTKFNIREVPKDCNCIVYKKYLIFLMLVQLVSYSASLFLVSIYNPVIEQEKTLMSVLIICMSINSVIFLLSQILFIFSLKYDLYYVNLNLQIRPDLEYFIDLDDVNNFKSTL